MLTSTLSRVATSIAATGFLFLAPSHQLDIPGAPPRPEVRATTPMKVARMAHTATTLPNGHVLVAGGFTGEASAAQSAELYDPSAERFTPLPRLGTLRHSHTATLLPNGRVLLAGGYVAGNGVTTAAEIFDPVTNSFSPTGSMRVPRAGHIAVPLASGKVLIAGGVGPDWTFLLSAELYDPATGAFTPTGAMTVARESHAAARLNDGRVLIVGGHRDRRANITLYTSAEAYDPATGVFTKVGDMRIRRHKHDAVLLRDGRVLVTGGSDERDDKGAYRSTELFDPVKGTFTQGPELVRARYKHNGSAVVLPTGRVLIAGGAAQVEVMDLAVGSSAVVPGSEQLSGQFSAVALMGAGRVLITGGYGANRGPQAGAWVYVPSGRRGCHPGPSGIRENGGATPGVSEVGWAGPQREGEDCGPELVTEVTARLPPLKRPGISCSRRASRGADLNAYRSVVACCRPSDCAPVSETARVFVRLAPPGAATDTSSIPKQAGLKP